MTPEGDFLELTTGKGASIKVLKAMHPRARRLRLSVTPHGARVSYPRGTHPAQVYAFLRENSDWLQRKLCELRIPRRGPPPLRAGVPTLIPLRGEAVELTWREGDYPHIEDRGNELCLHVPRPFTTAMPAARNLLAAYLETHMRRDLSRWMAQAAERLDAAPTGLRIKSLKSLWGSLDAHDRITLDLALALAPPAALRYVLVHEMCHLKVRSHSARFWARVGELMPGYQAQRDWLREHGAILKAEMERLIEARD
ncbi:MAG TPA: YgjP-like metallopeptidase domain-containing protein [Rhodanobacteraceae bacterium]|jgi:predicted metal-dependent hydrolase|nr:YgjP-like metallopeptidase domain-containing protein [Rhodanobacteraceae bacterium]